jgi:hypothetical protein
MSFERCTDITTKCFNTLHKDPDQRYSDQRKVEKLLKAIYVVPTRNLLRRKSSWKANTDVTSLALVATFHSKFPESTDQPSWSTDKSNPVSAAFMPLIGKQAAANGDEAAAMEEAIMAAEVDEAEDADGKMITEAGGDGVIISTVPPTLLTITEVFRGTNGIHWDPKVAPPLCYQCETKLRTEAAAPVVDVKEAAEDEFPSRTVTSSALSAWKKSSNTMPMHLAACG